MHCSSRHTSAVRLAFLIALASALAAGNSRAAADPAGQAAKLAEQGREFAQAGQWEKALDAAEKSLKLVPDDAIVLHDAMTACHQISSRSVPASVQNATPAQVRRKMEYCVRGFEHMEHFMRLAPNPNAYAAPGSGFFPMPMPNPINVRADTSRDVRALLSTGRSRVQDILLRVARQRLKDARGDEAAYVNWAVSTLPDTDAYKIRLQMIREWKDEPGNAKRIPDLAKHGWAVDILDKPEGKAFLADLKKIDSDEVRTIAQSLEDAAKRAVDNRKKK